MVKVLHVITHFDVGGAERVALNICKGRNADVDCRMVEVVGSKGEFANGFIHEMEGAKIPYRITPPKSNKTGILLFPFRFLRIALKERPDIIHTHTEVPDLSIFLWHLLFGWTLPHVRFVRTIHNTELWNGWGKIGQVVEKFFQKQHANVAIGKAVQQSYKKRFGEKVPIIYNGVSYVKQEPFDGCEKGKINILFAGRLESQKGIDQLVTVVKVLADRDDLFFHIVGNGSLEDKVKALKGQQNVRLYDKIFNLSAKMGAFDYFFMPSNFEGFGLTSVEASLAGTPVIANRCSGLDETLPEDWPLFVEGNSVEGYLEIFSKIGDFNHEELAATARNFVLERFSIDKMQTAYNELYLNE